MFFFPFFWFSEGLLFWFREFMLVFFYITVRQKSQFYRLNSKDKRIKKMKHKFVPFLSLNLCFIFKHNKILETNNRTGKKFVEIKAISTMIYEA